MSVTSKKDCFSIELPGRSRGRAWIDAATGDVLRLDEHLTGIVDVTLPKQHRLAGGANFVVVERLDSSVRYRPIAFDDPEEVLMLPVSITTITVVRNAGVPRLRSEQVFTRVPAIHHRRPRPPVGAELAPPRRRFRVFPYLFLDRRVNVASRQDVIRRPEA